MSGFYTAATAMLIQQRRLNTTANNMANAKTTGYRSERTIASTFNDILVGRQVRDKITPIGYGAPLTVVEEISSKFDIADLEDTGRPMDIAIGGDGFFNIDMDGTTYLTRNGNFEVNEEGFLVLKGVGQVMGSAGAIQLDNTDFAITESGEIYNSEGELVDTLLVTMVEDPSQLIKQPNGTYVSQDGAGLMDSNAKIYQGKLERSNVDLNQEMANMIEIQRAFQSVSNALKTIDQLNGKAISEIGRL